VVGVRHRPSYPKERLPSALRSRISPAHISEAADDLAALGPRQPPTPGLPNTGAGAASTSNEHMIPGELLIGGAILAFLAVVQHYRSGDQIARS
jgi:hypothetical protein